MALKGEVHERVGISENSLVQVDIEIVGFINESGQLAIAYGCDADAPISTIVGLMEQGKFELLKAWSDNSDFEDRERP